MHFKNIIISTPSGTNREEAIQAMFSEHEVHIHSTNYEMIDSKNEKIYYFTVSMKDKHMAGRLFHDMSTVDFIHTIKISG